MKKSLLATTALAALGVATVAAPASAEGFELKIGGFMEQWFGYTDSSNSAQANADAFAEHSDVEIYVDAGQTLDNGLTIKAHVELEAESAGATNADEQYLTIEGSFGKIIMGSENTAPYLMHYAAKTNGIGVEEGDGPAVWATGNLSGLTATNVHGSSDMHNDDNSITFVSPRFNGFQFGASFVPDSNNDDQRVPTTAARENDGNRDNGYGLAANYETSVSEMSVKTSIGYSDAGSDDTVTGHNRTLTGGLQLGFGGFVASAAYGEHKKDEATAINSDIFSTSLAYSAGPVGVSVLYVRGEDSSLDDKQDFFELGASYAVGPGVTAKGSVYYWDTVDGGVNDAEGLAIVGGLALSF